MSLVNSVKRIRACEGEVAAQLVMERLIDEAIGAERIKMEWVSVKDGLPAAKFDWVLVTDDGAVDCFGYSDEKGFHNPLPYDRTTNVRIDGITHWMTIPNPPHVLKEFRAWQRKSDEGIT